MSRSSTFLVLVTLAKESKSLNPQLVTTAGLASFDHLSPLCLPMLLAFRGTLKRILKSTLRTWKREWSGWPFRAPSLRWWILPIAREAAMQDWKVNLGDEAAVDPSLSTAETSRVLMVSQQSGAEQITCLAIRILTRPEAPLLKRLFLWRSREILGRYEELTVLSPNGRGQWTEPSVSLGHFLPARLQSVQGCEVWHARFVVKNDCRLLSEGRSDPRQEMVAGDHVFLRAQATTNSMEIISPGDQSVDLNKVYFACGRADENWFHWIVDHLPQLVRHNSRVPSEIPVLMREGLPKQVYESCAIALDRKILLAPQRSRLHISEMFVPIFPGALSDSLGQEEVNPVIDDEALLLLRETLAKQIPTRVQNSEQRFAFRNSRHRKFLDVKKTTRLLEKSEFTAVAPESLSFVEQWKTLQATGVLVADGGATLAGMLCMKPGSQVILICSSAKGQRRLWEQIGAALAISVITIEGKPKGHRSDVHADFSIGRRGVAQLRCAIGA